MTKKDLKNKITKVGMGLTTLTAVAGLVVAITDAVKLEKQPPRVHIEVKAPTLTPAHHKKG